MRTDLLKRCIAFGHELIKTGDLDPIYIALNGAQLDRKDLHNVCMAYWLFYDIGVASRAANMASKGVGLYDWMIRNYATLHRGTERRHFRGDNGMSCLAHLNATYEDATQPIERWFKELDYAKLNKRVQLTPQFGPWIAFKVADMGEACLGYPISFDDCKLAIYREPYKAAQLLLTGDKETKEDIQPVLDKLLKEFANTACPHNKERSIKLQEVETILCKFKSHLNGHYPVGKDSHEYSEQLGNFINHIAQDLRANLPQYA